MAVPERFEELKKFVVDFKDYFDNPDQGKVADETIKDVLAKEEVIKIGKSVKAYKNKIFGNVVDETVVVESSFKLIIDLYRMDMTGPVIDACDSLMSEFERGIKDWVDKENKERKEENNIPGQNKQHRKPLINLCKEHLMPIHIRRLDLANLKSTLKIQWNETSYRPPREWKSIVDAMATLKWFKQEKDHGFEPEMTWKKFYNFLVGYPLANTVNVQGGSIFGGENTPIGLLADLRTSFNNYFGLTLDEALPGMVATWKDLHEDIKRFNGKEDWNLPQEYSELGEKISNLHQEMKDWRSRFEKYLPAKLNLTEVKNQVEKLKQEKAMLKRRIHEIDEEKWKLGERIGELERRCK